MALVFASAEIQNIVHGDGIPVRDSVRAATTANGALATAYENGDTIDGVVLATNDRILLKDQTLASENGLYIVQATGAPVRADDLYDGADATFVRVWIQEGTANAGTGWVQKTVTTIGNALSWERYDVSGGTLPTVDSIPLYDDDQSHTYTFTGGALTASNKTVTLPAEAVWTTGGVTQNLVLDAGTQTLTNKTLTAPIVDEILGTIGGEEVLIFTGVASAVNEVTIANAITTAAPRISATGTDTNISLELEPKGTGSVDVIGGQTFLRLFDADDSASVGFQAAAVTADYTLTMPAAQAGFSGDVLINDGSGVLSWGTPTAASRVVYNFPFQISATSLAYQTVGYIAWDNATYGAYTNIRMIFEAVVATRTLDVRLYNTTEANSVIENTGLTSGTDGFITNTTLVNDPTGDSRLALQVRRGTGSGDNPAIYGIQIEWTTA